MITNDLGMDRKMSLATFIELRNYIHEKTGIYFDDNKKYLLENRLGRLLAKKGLDSFEEYHRLLKWNGLAQTDYNSLYDAITTNETYFLREPHHFEALVETIIPERKGAKEPGDKVRIWSAGCSTGDEPYTMSIYIRNKMGFLGRDAVEILASDISEQVLTTARRAIYNEYAVKEFASDADRSRYFDTSVTKSYRLRQDFRDMVRFSQVNLFDTSWMSMINNIDVIFCRNVIIYFSEDVKKKIINAYYESLNHGGYLILGHSESLHSISSAFKLVRVGNSLIYKKE